MSLLQRYDPVTGEITRFSAPDGVDGWFPTGIAFVDGAVYASSTGLFRLDLATGITTEILPLADLTRPMIVGDSQGRLFRAVLSDGERQNWYVLDTACR